MCMMQQNLTLNFLTPTSQNNATLSFCKYYQIDKEKMKADLLASELINTRQSSSRDGLTKL